MDEKISRGKLIKGGAAGALAVGALGVVEAAGAVNGSGAIHIHIHGVVTGTPHGGAPGVKLAITIDVAGRPNDLAGAGWDSGTLTTGPTGMKPGGPFPGGPAGACHYTAS